MTTRTSETATKLPTANDIKLINEAHNAAIADQRSGLEHAIECGVMLKAAKDKVGHGDWESWLVRNCPDIAPRTASHYMRLANKGDELEQAAQQNGKALADLSATAANKLLARPLTAEQKTQREKARNEARQKQQEQDRSEWIKTLNPTSLSDLLVSLWDAHNLFDLTEQIKKKLPAPAPTTAPPKTTF
jgi:hypothetical protein